MELDGSRREVVDGYASACVCYLYVTRGVQVIMGSVFVVSGIRVKDETSAAVFPLAMGKAVGQFLEIAQIF